MAKLPTITALMVTRGRMTLVHESYKCFCQQTYPNKKLLIVTDGNRQEREAVQRLVRTDRRLKVAVVEPGLVLGELRNIAIDLGTDLSMQWDDDDWYAPRRMEVQFEALKDNAAVLLREQLHYFRDTNEVAWVEDPSGIEGTLLFDRRCRLRYPVERRGEDTVLKEQLGGGDLLATVAGGIVYCRTFHGKNTWNRGHHLDRIRKMGKSKSAVRRDWSLLEEAARIYPWRKGWKVVCRT